MSERYVIEVDGLKKYFPLRDGLFGQQTGELRAVDGVSFNIRPGTIFGLVGESGSGKTTVGRTLLGLYEKSAGSVKFHGQDLADLTAPALRAIRPRMQLVFQDPYSSLNPRLRIGDAQLRVVHHLQFAPGNGIPRIANPQHLADTHRRLRVVAGDHLHADPGLQAVGNRRDGLRTRRAARDVHIDRNEFIHALDDGIDVVHPA